MAAGAHQPRPLTGQRWGMARVHGDSMLPVLRAGDRVLVHHGGAVRPGSLVLARLPDGALAVKRAQHRCRTASRREGWWLLSDNPDAGVDSRHRGAVPADRVFAVVVCRLWPRPGRLRRPGRPPP